MRDLRHATQTGVRRNQAAFSLIEVIIAAAILAMGLLSVVKVFPYGIQASQRAEDTTVATLLAQQIFEGLKMDSINFPILPGAANAVIPVPGNLYDDDTNNETFNVSRGLNVRNPYDLNSNRYPDEDFDGFPEADALQFKYAGVMSNGLDDDNDGAIDDDGDSGSSSSNSTLRRFAQKYADGDYYYDPEPNIDEEFPNGIDDDRDGLIDEDVRLASVRVLGTQFMIPLLAGDGMDNDGDGEYNPDNKGGVKIADGIDNNDDGRIDEGIDEEIWDGKDNDRDGMIDEDCRLAAFPYSPGQFPSPFDRFGWQISVGRIPDNGRYGFEDINGDGVPDLGNGIDDDGDGLTDEELPDGLDFDFPIKSTGRQGLTFLRMYSMKPQPDGLIDEDCVSPVLPNWRRMEILITWGGDGEDNDGDMTSVDPTNKLPLGVDDPSRVRRQRVSFGAVTWGIDEEKQDGLDNDFDGLIDEDTYLYEFKLIGFINLKNPSESFAIASGQPRGVASTVVADR